MAYGLAIPKIGVYALYMVYGNRYFQYEIPNDFSSIVKEPHKVRKSQLWEVRNLNGIS